VQIAPYASFNRLASILLREFGAKYLKVLKRANASMTFSKLNFINVGPHGTFRSSGQLQTTPADIDALFAHLKATNAEKLAVHFHGGLVRENKGGEIARSMQPVYEAGGAHAVTFIWETGLIETLTRNLTRLNETELFKKLVRYVFRQLTKRLGADISGRGPGQAMTLEEIEAELSRIEKFEDFESKARSGAEALDEASLEFVVGEMEMEFLLELQGDLELVDANFSELVGDVELAPEIDQELRDAGGRGVSLFQIAKHLAKVTYRVLKRYIRKRDHGIYPTVIEEIGREFYLADFGFWIWARMKDVACEMWQPNGAIIDENAHPGSYFLKKLQTHQAAHPNFKLDLVGHSAGAIAICEMLRVSARVDTMPEIRNIMLLAPACLTQLMHDEIVSHPDRYERFRMFTMSDDNEQKDRLVPLVYTRSLLYLISGILEDAPDTPIAGMERFWTAAVPFDDPYIVETTSWLRQPGEDRMVLSVTPAGTPEGLQSASIKHGDFDNDPTTRNSLTNMVRPV